MAFPIELVVLLPIALTVVSVVMAGRFETRRNEAFARGCAAVGLPLRPGANPWIAEGVYDGVPIAAEPFSVTRGRGMAMRTAVRATGVFPLADLGVYERGEVPADALGAMQEIGLIPEAAARFRCFAADPTQAQQLLSTAVQQCLTRGVSARELRVQRGALVLVLDGYVTQPEELLRAADLVAATLRQRPPRVDLAPAPPPTTNYYFAVAPAAWISGFALGILLMLIPGVAERCSPLVCRDGRTLHLVGTSHGNGRNSGDFYCVGPGGPLDREGPYYLKPLVIGFTAVHTAVALLLLLRAMRERVERDSA